MFPGLITVMHKVRHSFDYRMSAYNPVLRCQVFHDLKPLCYSYNRVTSVISNFLVDNTSAICMFSAKVEHRSHK